MHKNFVRNMNSKFLLSCVLSLIYKRSCCLADYTYYTRTATCQDKHNKVASLTYMKDISAILKRSSMGTKT